MPDTPLRHGKLRSRKIGSDKVNPSSVLSLTYPIESNTMNTAEKLFAAMSAHPQDWPLNLFMCANLWRL
ncbi:hypothetical protein [Duganella rhizosphaerae]|uniref:hypothetical protein n=1 Tax=Duganella rhizosphaerae TaxID=2885763 RepID=UPI00403F98B9